MGTPPGCTACNGASGRVRLTEQLRRGAYSGQGTLSYAGSNSAQDGDVLKQLICSARRRSCSSRDDVISSNTKYSGLM